MFQTLYLLCSWHSKTQHVFFSIFILSSISKIEYDTLTWILMHRPLDHECRNLMIQFFALYPYVCWPWQSYNHDPPYFTYSNYFTITTWIKYSYTHIVAYSILEGINDLMPWNLCDPWVAKAFSTPDLHIISHVQ
jgi:hypothetical protein